MEANKNKTALITGFTGQDGTFLTKYLLELGYTVVGLVRRVSTEPPHRVRGKFDFSRAIDTGQLILEHGDLLSVDSLVRIINTHRPDEVYNLAAQSDVHISFSQPEFTIQADFNGVVNLITALEAVEAASRSNAQLTIGEGDSAFTSGKQPYNWKLYQASTSEMFGDQKSAMDEDTNFLPNSPYSIAKTAAHFYCRMKRSQGKFVACGILFNHESEIRGGNFVTQKIARRVADLVEFRKTMAQTEADSTVDINALAKTGPVLQLGNTDSVRDWGYAGDYVKAMHAMLQHDTPDDYVVGTGETHSIREFVEAALNSVGLPIEWRGSGIHLRGYVQGALFVEVVEKYWRPVDVRYLEANNRKAQDVLHWKPSVDFERLVDIMVQAALERKA